MSCNNCNGHNCNCNHGCSAILVDGNFTYQAWADDRDGTNFSLSPTRSDGSKYGYTAIIIRDHVVDRLVAKDFEDRWFPIEGFLVVGDDISLLNNDIPYLKNGDNVSELNNDVPYLINSDLANYLQQGDNISLLVNDMGYINTNAGLIDALGYIPENEANKNQAGGYPTLDSSGKVPLSQLPNINFAGQIYIYDTEVEMNASTDNINGNLAILQNPSGNTKSYLYYEGDWLPVTSFNVSSINGQTGDITGVVFESDLLWGMGTGQDALLQKNGNNTASGTRAITIGQNNDNGGSNSFVGGVGNDLDNNSFKTFVWGNNIDAKGVNAGFITGGNHDINVVNASATYLFVCGTSNRVLGGSTVFVEGNNNTANANFSHVEGQYNTVIGAQAHAQNQYTLASGTNSHTGGQGKGIGSPLRLVTASGVASFNHSRIYDETIGSDAKGENSFIAGGSDNNVGSGTQGQNSHIAGGQRIDMKAQFSGSVGGQDNELNGTNVGILGGKDHLIDNGISNSAIVGGEGILADRDNTAYSENIEIVGECSMFERQATQSQNTSSQIKWLIDLTKGNMFNCFTDNKSSVILDFTKPNPNQKSSTFVVDLKDTNADEKTLAFTTTSNMDIFYTNDNIDVGVNKKTEIWGRYSKSDNAIYLSTNGGFIKAN